MALGLDDLRVGVWTHPEVPTGCTVLLPPEGTLGAIAVRGSSPGTREAAALGPLGKVEVCHGVVLSGGSAYGLATADGVVRWLEERGVGYPVRIGRVPIVGAAIVLDLAVAFPDARPDAAAGRAACDAATTDDPPEGAIGAGAGASVAKVGGFEHAWRGGQGVAVRRHGELVVSAIVVTNAVGDVIDRDGSPLVASRAPADAPRFPYVDEPFHGDTEEPHGAGPAGNTVIGCVVTNARLTKVAAHRVADLGHTGVARAVEPAHTQADGDALFCLATGQVDAGVDLVAALAADAVAEAVRRGPTHARSLAPVTLLDGSTFPALPGAADV
jgi:L-aminopeptidase/D-esterase-like protein